MKKMMLGLGVTLAIFQLTAAGFESIDSINSFNWTRYLDHLTGYVYESHGCLHFSPADMYIVYKVVPKGVSLTIKNYGARADQEADVPFLAEIISSPNDLKTVAGTFKGQKTELVFYPLLSRLFFIVNGAPYAKVFALAGPPEEYLAAHAVQKGKPIAWDFMLTTPSDPGKYKILKATDHYLSSAYYENTIVPFGAWIKKTGNNQWVYQKNDRWYALPKNILRDVKRAAGQRAYNYYDINYDARGDIIAARYAGHDFGKYVLLWTKDGKNHYAEMGYAAGELVYEQVVLIKDLVHLLTVPGADDFFSCVEQNENFGFYRSLYEFVASKGEKVPAGLEPAIFSYYKLYYGWKLSRQERRLLDERALKAFNEFRENRLPRQKRRRWEAIGLYRYIQTNSWLIDKQAAWYEGIMNNWDFYRDLRQKLRHDFEQMGILSLANRQNILESWLNERLAFKSVQPPPQAKYVQPLTFSTFFKPEDDHSLFAERERAVMLAKIKQATSAEAGGLNLSVVEALNNYNFGLLLNEILGDLYRSHGCLHVSPRNMNFLYEILPLGGRLTVLPYSERISAEALSRVPLLADLVNFREGLDKLKVQLANKNEVQIAVYPFSGDWIIYAKSQPLARVRVKGGPQTKFYVLQDRDESGKPIFENNLAYPTTPGNYYLFRKVEDYVSNLYYETTIIPMGGVIRKQKNRWVFQNKRSDWRTAPKIISEDLQRTPEERRYSYYDLTKNSSGELIAARWGSHPFGNLVIQNTLDFKSPSPEFIHSSGDLIMEERQLIKDLIRVLTAPYDQLDECIKQNLNFEFYKACFEFVRNPSRTDLIQAKERAAYRLYHNLPLASEEAGQLPGDVIIANKILRGLSLSADEIKILIAERLAYYRGGKLKINMEKILGLQFDAYQYVVAVQKYSRHYEVLKKHWAELSRMRLALLKDFNTFVLKDVSLFHEFMRELMLKRNRLERLTQANALQKLKEMLTEAELE